MNQKDFSLGLACKDSKDFMDMCAVYFMHHLGINLKTALSNQVELGIAVAEQQAILETILKKRNSSKRYEKDEC